VALIGGFRCDLSITRKTDGNFSNIAGREEIMNETFHKQVKTWPADGMWHYSVQGLTLICSQGSLKKERTWPEITEQSIVKR